MKIAVQKYFVIPAKAGIQFVKCWIPGQARNDGIVVICVYGFQ